MKTSILLAVLYTTGAIAMDISELATFYKKYDTPDDEYVEEEEECMEGEIAKEVCPEDLKIACTTIEEIEAWCKSKLGDAVGDSSGEKEKGTNALEGCAKYIGYHVLTHDHLACCPSDHCDTWLEDLFESSGYYNDDDDGEYYDDDDDALSEEDLGGEL